MKNTVKFLCLGENFSSLIKKLPVTNLITNIEYSMKNIIPDLRNTVINDICCTLNWIYKIESFTINNSNV